ncbi:MAG: DUF721 domain-containing protein [Chitinophagales bacterium]|nr:DUF721 domain-containing protein [Chitinophagales bacterium]
MKRQNDQPIKEVIAELLQTYHLKEKMNEVKLLQHWESLFGKTISKYTEKMFVSNKKLYLTINSAPLRQELMYNRQVMMERINEAIEKDFIREVVLR